MTILYIFVLVIGAVAAALLTRAAYKTLKAEHQIRKLAFYDPLTGLTNRRLFQEKITLELSHARRDQTPLALMYLDLDHFKPINDELGHNAGDFVLQEVAERLKMRVRETDTIARLGGDEFAVILPKSGTETELTIIAQRIIDIFKSPFHPFGHERYLGISIGITQYSETDEHSEELIRRADQAMYQAKNEGRNCFRFNLVNNLDDKQDEPTPVGNGS